ncbi:SMI1/KNR4 family protein [Paenibacillus tarimensis]|uniref:SMI1/KNR4 family protein n=1 Tax=Paenibacillus tarimensis TaxID=416012 RepID=UPI001F239602|nr:SMI1/KNR4 family protein [Paenibacillus tarimensis]MCF2946460.1 SMI1/KNR4 family protein [Paenibacillus tarimensis]
MEQVRNLILTRKPGVKDEDINITEEMLGIRFPNKYKQLVNVVNQAEVGEWILFPIKDSQRIHKTFDDIVKNNKDTDLPDEYIAFAEDGTGDLLCYRVSDGAMGEQIYLWNHEEGSVEEIYKDIEEMIIDLS